MKDTAVENYMVRMGVPSGGVPVYSDIEFDDPEQAQRMMKEAYGDGNISGWTLYKVVRVIAYHRIDGQGEESE